MTTLAADSPVYARCSDFRTARPSSLATPTAARSSRLSGADAPNAVALVYVAAFGLHEGESIGALLSQGPVTPAIAHLNIDKAGFAWIPEDDFVSIFAADVAPVKAKVKVRRAAAVDRGHPRGSHGCSGVKVAAVLVFGRRWRSGDPTRCRASVRQAHGCNHSRSADEPRGDGPAPG